MTVLIRENGQPIQTNPVQEEKEEKDTPKKEHAAALQDPKRHAKLEPLPSKTKGKSNTRNPLRSLKPIIFTVLSAVIVGLILGFLMLRMFGGVGSETANEMTSPATTVPNETVNTATDEPTTSNETTASVSLEPLNMFILQGGVFSENNNAAEREQQFEAAGVPAMIWERDGQSFLLAGAAVTKEAGTEVSDTFSQLDVYVKEWSIEATEFEGSAEAAEWLTKFQDVWQDSLQQIEEGNAFQQEPWQQLMETAPENNETVAPLIEQIQDMGQTEDLEGRVALLEVLYMYEQTIK